MLILFNKLNGKKARINAEKIALLLKTKYEFIEIRSIQEPKTILDEAIITHAEIIIAGGDGTFHHFINRYDLKDKTIGFISLGTGNDFARQLYGNSNWKDQLKTILKNHSRHIDLLQINDKKCINNLGIGFDGSAAMTAEKLGKWLPSSLKYTISILFHLFFYKEKNFCIESVEKTSNCKLLLASVANGAFSGGGYKLFPKANLFDNLLDICIIQKTGILRRLTYFIKVATGKHTMLSFVNYTQQKECTIKTDLKIPYHMDGEVYFENEWNVRSISSIFKVFVPVDLSSPKMPLH